MDIDNDSHPVAMGSGMLLGMALGVLLSAGTLAWHDAAARLCGVMAIEAGRSAAECPRPAAAYARPLTSTFSRR